jgi:hypothetical protein
MSIDRYIYVTPDPRRPLGRAYNNAIVRDIIDDLNNKGGKEHGLHSVYIMQHGIEYLYNYVDAAHAQEDFNTWRAEPCESIQLKLNGQWQEGGRLPLTEEQIRAWQEMKAAEEDDDPDFDDFEEDDELIPDPFGNFADEDGKLT